MELLAMFVVCVLVVTVVMPWVNHGRLLSRGREVERLKQEVERLSRKVLDLESPHVKLDQVLEQKVQVAKEQSSPVVPPPMPEVVGRSQAGIPVSRDDTPKAGYEFFAAQERAQAAPRTPIDKQERGAVDEALEDASQDWFSRLAVWVGGVALLMAGFYMIKYSIDSGWLTPSVRVWITTTFGVLLCVGGFWVSRKSDSPGDLRVGQALTGAGVACLYFAVYAAVNLYGFVTAGVGFGGMVVVTGVAVALSLRHGAPIALMGFVGGFLTPMLMGDFRDDTVLLFGYLFVLYGAAQFLCVKRGWWGLFLSSLVAVYTWSASLLISYSSGYAVYPEGALFFLIGVCALNAVLSLRLDPSECSEHVQKILALLRVFAWGGGLLQALLLVCLSGYEGADIGLFALLSFGALALGVIREAEFSWAGWLALCALLIAAFANAEPSWLQYLAWPVGVALVFFLVGHFKALKSEQSGFWRGLSLGALILTLIVVYVNRQWMHGIAVPIESFWLLVSVGMSALILGAAEHMYRIHKSDTKVVGEYSSFAWFVFGFGLCEMLAVEYWSLAIVGLLLSAAAYWRVRSLACSELVLGVLIAAWLVTMFERIVSALDYVFGLHEFQMAVIEWTDLGAWYAGVVALAVVLRWFGRSASVALRNWCAWLLGLAALLAAVVGYRAAELAWFPEWWQQSTVEGGLTALLAVLGLGAMFAVWRWSAGTAACWLLTGLSAYRIVALHLLGVGARGDSFFWNALFWQFGVPFIVAFAIAWLCRVRAWDRSARVYQIAAMALGFVWATFLVQDYSGSSKLFSSISSSTELYTYSVVWLLLAVAYQAMGLWRGLKTLHIGSLILLLLTVGKVFLVDASELEGLYRVLSFLGLGVALIGIGFFYNKVVFTPAASEK